MRSSQTWIYPESKEELGQMERIGQAASSLLIKPRSIQSIHKGSLDELIPEETPELGDPWHEITVKSDGKREVMRSSILKPGERPDISSSGTQGTTHSSDPSTQSPKRLCQVRQGELRPSHLHRK